MNNRVAKLALAELDARGWAKFNTIAPDGKVCVNGAIMCADARPEEKEALRVRLLELISVHFPGRCGGGQFAQQYFNDHPDTTEADIRFLLAHA